MTHDPRPTTHDPLPTTQSDHLNNRRCSFNVHVRQEVTPAAHFVQLKRVHDLPFRGLVDVFFGQINDLLSVHAAGHLESPHFAEIVFVFVGDDVAAREALDRNDHCCNWFLIVVLIHYF